MTFPPTSNDPVAYSEAQPSCHGCRQRKQKCSREKPSCSNCERLGISCIYDARKRKPGLKTGAVEGLAKRVGMQRPDRAPPKHAQTVDEFVEALEKALDEPTGPNAATSSSQSGGGIDTNVRVADSLNSLTATLQTLTDKIGSLEHRAPSENTPLSNNPQSDDPEQVGETGPRPKRRRVDDGHDRTAPAPFTNRSTFASRCSYTQLPAELLDDVVRLYFMRIHNWIPIIHWNRFKQRFRRQPLKDKLGVILDAMLVGTLKFVDREKYDLSGSDVHRISSQARESALLIAMSSLSVENLQALIILVFIDMGDDCASRAWAIIGSLSRTVEYLQLSIEDNGDKARRFHTPLSILPPSEDWTEKEERRRVFWTVFNLDRFCSITTGWNTSLTSDDVSRRLPADGTCWYLETPVSTPYFGIWDKSAASIGNSLAFLPAIATRPAQDIDAASSISPESASTAGGTSAMTDLQSIGGLAYLIEATESMSRIASYFLRQSINFRDEREVTSWLIRFKELDLRLVHWKMFLPKRWKDPTHVPCESTGPKYHDHGMTLAHVMHNTSIIILHSRIAYSIPQWYDIVQLPSSASAETCRLAAIETTGITAKYLSFCPDGILVAPQFAFCTFITAKVLLVHSQCYNQPVQSEFWSMIDMLEQMARRWAGLVRYNPRFCDNIAGRYAEKLRILHHKCESDPLVTLDVLDYPNDSFSSLENVFTAGEPSQNPSRGQSNTSGRKQSEGETRESTPGRHPVNWNDQPFFMDSPPPEEQGGSNKQGDQNNTQPSVPARPPPPSFPMIAPSNPPPSYSSHLCEPCEPENDLVALSQAFMGQSFADMDRIIGLGDSFLGDLNVMGEAFSMPAEEWRLADIDTADGGVEG